MHFSAKIVCDSYQYHYTSIQFLDQPDIWQNQYPVHRAVDPHSLYADPVPAVFLNADPDPDLDPDPGPGLAYQI